MYLNCAPALLCGPAGAGPWAGSRGSPALHNCSRSDSQQSVELIGEIGASVAGRSGSLLSHLWQSQAAMGATESTYRKLGATVAKLQCIPRRKEEGEERPERKGKKRKHESLFSIAQASRRRGSDVGEWPAWYHGWCRRAEVRWGRASWCRWRWPSGRGPTASSSSRTPPSSPATSHSACIRWAGGLQWSLELFQHQCTKELQYS